MSDFQHKVVEEINKLSNAIVSNLQNQTENFLIIENVLKHLPIFNHELIGSSVNGNKTELQQVFENITSIIDSPSKLVENSTPLNDPTSLTFRFTYYLCQLNEKHKFKYSSQVFVILISTILIILGTFASIKSIPYTALPPTVIHPLFDPSDFELDTECHIVYKDDKTSKKKKQSKKQKNSGRLNQLEEKHAILLPLSSSITLVGLYYVITKLNIKWMNYIIKGLTFNIILISLPAGIFVYSYLITAFIRNFAHLFNLNTLRILSRYRVTISDDNADINKSSGLITNYHYKDPLNTKDPDELYFQDTIDNIKKNGPMIIEMYKRELTEPTNIKSNRQLVNLYFNISTLLSSIISSVLVYQFYKNQTNWIFSNLISMNFTIWSISQINFKNLRTGVLVLSILFFYDIYFVFGTNMMVTVATNLELPVKLLIPNGMDKLDPKKLSFGLIGLGDICLPGMFLSICYKFDIWRYHNNANKPEEEFHLLNWKYIGKYFILGIINYILALVICISMMVRYDRGQPALLYIVPMITIPTIILAFCSGELKTFWTFQYDTIELGANLLEDSDQTDSENQDKDKGEPLEGVLQDEKKISVTYSEYFNITNEELYDEHDDSVDYDEQDALLDEASDNEYTYSEDNTLLIDNDE